MAFANLFTKLCGVQDAEKDSDKPYLGYSSEFKNGKDCPSRKRKYNAEHTGTYVKKQRFQVAASCGVSSKVPYNHKDKALGNNQSERFTNDANKQTKKKKKKNKGKKKQEMAQRYRNQNNPNKRGRGRNEDNKPPPKLFMTQEFKDQNALEVDGRLICKHHLRGRCIKGDECQLEHIQGYNNLIQEACKHYIQGFCLNGETCPYMHQSFPCKFFHKKGSCRRDDCKFSHDPLTDFTEKLLDDAIRRDNELLELNKMDKQGQNENVQVSEATEENIDIIIQPVRPNFYQTSDTNVDEEASLSHTEQPANTTDQDTPLQTEVIVEPDNVTPSTLNDPGPVCYSVEALLGPQLYKPCFYTNPKTTGDSSPNNLNAPYSVTNVLRSRVTASHLPPITKTVATTSKLKERDTSSRLDDKFKVSHFNNTLKNPDNVQEKSFTQPPSTNVRAVSEHSNKQCENEALKSTSGPKMISELQKTKERTNTSILINPTAMKKPGTSVSEYLHPIGNTNPAQNCETPKQQVKAQLLDPNRKWSPTLQDTTTAFPKTSHKSTNQAASNHTNLQKPHSGQSLDTKQSDCIKNVAQKNEESVLRSNLATSCDKTTTGAFHGLFTSLVPDPKQASNVSTTSFFDRRVVPIAPSPQMSPKREICDSRKSIHLIEHSTENISLASSSANSKVQREERSGRLDSDCNKIRTRLFASLHPDVADAKTMPNVQEDHCANTQVCGPSQATKSSKLTKNRRTNIEGGVDLAAKYCETSNIHCQKLVSSSITSHSKGENIKETIKSHKTPAKSFSSLFAAPLSKHCPTNDSAISESLQKSHQSVAISEFCEPSHAQKPSNVTEHTTESTNNEEGGVCLVAAPSKTSNKPCQKSNYSFPTSSSKEKKGEDTKNQVKSFSSLFAAPLSKTCSTNYSPISKMSSQSINSTDLKINDKVDSHTSSPENKKTEPSYGTKESSEEHKKKNTVCSSSSNSSNTTSTSQVPQHQTDGLSHNGPPNSVLRSLFQCLGPYQEPHQIQTNIQPKKHQG